MSELNPFSALTDEQLKIIHSAGEAFEQALQADASADLESFLDRAPAELRGALICELLAIELEWRNSRGSKQDKAQYLDRFPDLSKEIERVIAEHQQQLPQLKPTFVENSTPRRSDLPNRTLQFAAGAVIDGRFTIVELIGEGGMGSVYLAEQHAPVTRQVAIKFIKGGMDSKEILSRFNAERQVLAMMDHPNIARVFEGGTTETGLPFFVMELVRGIPIARYCDENCLSVRSRLKLFISICNAVQHAHLKGIIHRDLKPGNILIAEFDGRPTPKVIDFGVAKAMHQKVADQSLASLMVVGTPAYMSPEQADPGSMDIDSRTDVYSLGVVLYELLTGSPPHDSGELKPRALLDALRLIREVESPRPSTKVHSSQALQKIAAHRDIEPEKLASLLRGELDWIALKALEKDRNRRYETVNAFCRDIERYLDGEMVEARPPSATYRFQKFVNRNRVQVVAGSLIFLSLIAGMAGTVWGWMEANRQTKTVQAEVIEKERALKSEAQQKHYAEAIADFVIRDFLALTTLEGRLDFDGPDSKLTKDSTLGDLLDRAAQKLDERTDLDPRAEARLRWMLGRSFLLQDDYPKAIELFQRSYDLYLRENGPDDLATLGAQDGLADALQSSGKHESARPLINDSLQRKKAQFGEAHVETLDSMRLLAMNLRSYGQPAEAVPILERTLELRRTLDGPEGHETLTAMFNLAMAHDHADQRTKAVTLLEQTLELQQKSLGTDHPDTNATTAMLAAFYRQAGQFERAFPLVERVLEWTKNSYGNDHLNTAMELANLGCCFRDAGQVDRAIPLFEEALAICQKNLEPDHPDIANAMTSLAMGYRANNSHDRALQYFEQALKLRARIYSRKHPATLAAMANVASCYAALGRAEKAQDMNEQCLALATEVLGPDHGTTLSITQNLAVQYWKARKLDQSIPLFEKVLAAQVEKLGRDHLVTVTSIENLGVNYRDAGLYDKAVPLLEEAYQASAKFPSRCSNGIELLDAYLQAGKTEQGMQLLAELMIHVREEYGANSSRLAGHLATIGQVLVRSRAFAESELLLRECLTIRQASEPESWRTFSVTAMLGESILGLGKPGDAETLLLAGYEGMVQRAESAPPQAEERLVVVVDRLIELFASQNKSTEVTQWQEERAKYLPALGSVGQD